MKIIRLGQPVQTEQMQAAQAAIQNVAGMLTGLNLQAELNDAISPEAIEMLLKDISKNISQMPTLSNAIAQLSTSHPDLKAEEVSSILTSIFAQSLIDNKATMENDLRQAVTASITKYINTTDLAIQSQNGLTAFLAQRIRM